MTRLANKSLCFTTVSPTMDIHVNSVEPKKKKKKSECNPLIYSNDFICTTHSMVSLDVMGLEICAGMERQHACGGFKLLLVLKFLAFWNMLLNCAECIQLLSKFSKNDFHRSHLPLPLSLIICLLFVFQFFEHEKATDCIPSPAYQTIQGSFFKTHSNKSAYGIAVAPYSF